jgi:hypothetical protein
MSMSDNPTRGPAKPGPYITAGLLLAIGIVMPLLVPMYAHRSPELWGLPFFYWYQLLWVPMESLLVWITYLIVRREDRRRRAAVRGDRTDATEAEK